MPVIKCFFHKSSILVPISMIFQLFIEPTRVYIQELGLFLDAAALSFIFLTLSLLWFCCSPLRRSCCDGSWSELLFNLTPVVALLVLIFAQWHLALTVLVGVVVCFLVLAAQVVLGKGEKTRPPSPQMRKQYQYAIERLSLLIIVTVCAVPCCIAAFIYELGPPVYEGDQELSRPDITLMQSAETEGYPELFLVEQGVLSRLWDDSWRELSSAEERLTVLQALVHFEAQRLGIPSVPIKSEKLGSYSLGSYDWDANVIWIDLEYLMTSDAENHIATVCHEMYHAAQDYLINNIDWESTVVQSAYFSQIRSWKENASNYRRAWEVGYDEYAKQPLEQSARTYAEEEAAFILSYLQ